MNADSIADRPPAPAGKIEMVVTSLQMTAPPPAGARPHRLEPVAILQAVNPTLSYYRYLYNTVGQQWLWYERRVMDNAQLAAIIHDPAVAVSVLYVAGVPAGYAELDARVDGEVELAYLGLIPEFIGRGFGRFLLRSAIDIAWRSMPCRVWVHTCNLDHSGALAVYQRAGFEVYQRDTKWIDDPRPLMASG